MYLAVDRVAAALPTRDASAKYPGCCAHDPQDCVDDRLSRARAPWPTRLDASSLRAMRKVRGVTPLLYSLLGEALDRVPCLIEAMGAPLNLSRGERGAVSSVARPPPLSAITPRG